jgi:LacI family transcriptional regulator
LPTVPLLPQHVAVLPQSIAILPNLSEHKLEARIFCANDLMAVGCYEALHELGLRIPDDVAVIGYDDRDIAQHLHPPLTTVLLPHFEMGSIAAEMLLDAASGSTSRPRQIKVECPIVKRGSV